MSWLRALERHPLSDAWPDMPQDELEALVADVRDHGVRQPIALFDGRVIDGWHRLKAAIRAGLHDVETFKLEDSPEGDDPAGYVIACNGYRRHLTKTQRVAAIVAAERWREDHNNCGPTSARKIAKRAGASVSMVEQVRKRVREGHGETLRTGRETLATLRRKERAQAAKKDTIGPLTRMERLQAENARLQGRVDALEKENGRLRGELAALRGGAIE